MNDREDREHEAWCNIVHNIEEASCQQAKDFMRIKEARENIEIAPRSDSNVDHPDHYGGALNPYEAIKVIEAWGLGFNLGNTVKYISRAGKKNTGSMQESKIEDLQKAAWYLNREITNLLTKDLAN